MPYSNVPKKKWADMDSCVEQVLAKHKGEKGFGKENAVAICYNQIMGELGRMGGPESGGLGGQCVCPKCGAKVSHDTGEPCDEKTCPKCGAKMTRQAVQGGLSLEPVTAQDLAEYSSHPLLAQVEFGELMKFKNALVCCSGENKNGDWINEDGIEELVATLNFMAIDDEHNQQLVTGFFVNPRSSENSTKAYTDGILFARRFPDVAKQVQSGEKRLSIEAVAQRAVCSVCGGEFSSVKEYCEHLMDKETYGAVRKLYGLQAKGGATVFHPAWDTSFDANGFVMIASQVEFEPREVNTPKWVIDLIAKIEGLVSRLKPVMLEPTENDHIKGGVQMSEVNVDELNLEKLGLVQASERDTLKADLEAKLAEKDAEAEKLKIGFARTLEMGMEAGQLEILADMSEDAYQLLKSQRAEPSMGEPPEGTPVQAGEGAPAQGTPVPVAVLEGGNVAQTTVLEGGAVTQTVPLTWETVGSVLKLKKEV